MFKKVLSLFLCFYLIFSITLWTANAASETEINNGFDNADITYDDYDNYGSISTEIDIDMWKITFSLDGLANFYLGNIPSGCDYDIKLYASDRVTVLARSETRATGGYELIEEYYVTAGETYYVMIVSHSGCSSVNYLFRAKNYSIPPLLGGDYLRDISNSYYYIDSTTGTSATFFSSVIADAAYNWVNTGYGSNALDSFTRTYIKSVANIEIQSYYKDTDGVLAYTTAFIKEIGTTEDEDEVAILVSDWDYNRVKINNCSLADDEYVIDLIDHLNIDATVNEFRQSVIAHEFGHCFGLYENNTNPHSIMCQTGSGRDVFEVQEVDYIAFNRKH